MKMLSHKFILALSLSSLFIPIRNGEAKSFFERTRGGFQNSPVKEDDSVPDSNSSPDSDSGSSEDYRTIQSQMIKADVKAPLPFINENGEIEGRKDKKRRRNL